ncbi:MAG: CPBP family intramembrane metalloprotease [Acidobacteria bacterium]|nr:CPBP family intramembrane metalloprotease [Acidobacteriota bacterium]
MTNENQPQAGVPERSGVTPPAQAAGGSVASTIIRIVIYAFFCWFGMLLLAPLFYVAADTLITFVAAVFGAAAIANVICLRIYERRSFAEVGLGWSGASLRHLAYGLLGGAAVAALTVLIPLAMGLASWKESAEKPSGWATLAYFFVLLLFGVVGEELMFRGYGFQIMVRRFGAFATLLPMGVLFAAAHSGNMNVSYLGLVNTFLWGVALGWCVLRSGDLWLAIGVHAGWNWTLPLLGVNLSGFTMRVTGVELQWKLDALWSGGDYGPEGGLLSLCALLLLLAGLYKAPVQPQRLVLLEPGALGERSES